MRRPLDYGIRQSFSRGLPQTLIDKFEYLWTKAYFIGDNLKCDFNSDVITVTGKDFTTTIPITSSATFKLPNTTAYHNADGGTTSLDYFWFTIKDIDRNVTAPQLVGFDYDRTFVCFADSFPYSISKIGILKNGVTLTDSEKNICSAFFRLPMYFFGTLNLYGVDKTNRNYEKKVWLEELYTAANAAGIVNEANATTGLTPTGLTSPNIFQSQSTIVSNGVYAIKADCNAVHTPAAKFYADLYTYLKVGLNFDFVCKTRHTGTGGNWVIGFHSANNNISVGGLTIVVTYLTYMPFSYALLLGSTNRYFVCREQNINDDGGIYLDEISIKIRK